VISVRHDVAFQFGCQGRKDDKKAVPAKGGKDDKKKAKK
jgi:hypothetical protein